jgi:hypothetical protein
MRYTRKFMQAFLHKALLWQCLLTAGPVFAYGPPPVIIVQPLSTSVLSLGIATFTVVASSGTTMTYQWTKDGQDILGATSATYSLLSATRADAGSYAVKVTNAGGTVTSSTAVLAILTPPSITSQPQSQSVMKGGSFMLAVGATGTGPLSYNWMFNGHSLSGATTSSLSFTNVSNGRGGAYYVIVSNPYGSATSAVATISILVPLEITRQPTNQVATPGSEVLFAVSASGNGSMLYQWSFKGSPIGNETNSTLSIKSAQPDYAGNYTVKVTDSIGSVTSSPARLTIVAPAPALSAATVSPGPTSGAFSFNYFASSGFTYVIEATTDLQHWAPIATNSSATGAVSYSDPSASSYPSRFYRVVAASQ